MIMSKSEKSTTKIPLVEKWDFWKSGLTPMLLKVEEGTKSQD